MPDNLEPERDKLVRLETIVQLLKADSDRFRGEVRDWFTEIKISFTTHLSQDDKRFADVYSYLERRAMKLTNTLVAVGTVVLAIIAIIELYKIVK